MKSITYAFSLYPSHPAGPRVVITNGMVIPNYSSKADYERMFGIGVTMYGQMTAGSYCCMFLHVWINTWYHYNLPVDIGPQGIVHGTTITVLNAGRKYLNTEDLRGRVFVTSGLGGMSGAQAKAGVICGAVCVIAEISGTLWFYKHFWVHRNPHRGRHHKTTPTRVGTTSHK